MGSSVLNIILSVGSCRWFWKIWSESNRSKPPEQVRTASLIPTTQNDKIIKFDQYNSSETSGGFFQNSAANMSGFYWNLILLRAAKEQILHISGQTLPSPRCRRGLYILQQKKKIKNWLSFNFAQSETELPNQQFSALCTCAASSLWTTCSLIYFL